MNKENGFSLVELLVVVAVIGVLVGIAIPKWLEYKKSAIETKALSDLKNSFTAEEAYYVDHEVYIACNTSNCTTLLPGFVRTNNVKINIGLNTAGDVFGIATCHPSGDSVFQITSDNTANINNISGSTCESDPTLPALP